MTLAVLGHDFAYEMECVARIFFAGAKISIVKGNSITEFKAVTDAHKDAKAVNPGPVLVTAAENSGAGRLKLIVQAYFDSRRSDDEREITGCDNAAAERTLAAMLFGILSRQTGRRPAWGILTGIRPVRLCGKWSEEGLSRNGIEKRFADDYLVLPEKAGLCLETYDAQKEILLLNTPDTFSLYVSVPFCPTRCLYCSFVSHAIGKAARLVPDYVRLLCEEIRYEGEIAKRKNRRLLSVYIGGGTPTALEAAQIKQILDAVNTSFDLSHLLEYTAEAGRPDTITEEKLEIMRACGVARISVNPQSMNDNVLRAIGRPHTGGQARQSVLLAKRFGFKSINMDLIAGLPEETAESFAESLDRVLDLSPDNVTIHTLTVKRSSHLRERDDAFSKDGTGAAGMLGGAVKKLKAAGYFPYYLYRQKATLDNLENVGFSKPGHMGVYNIYSMEDTHNIVAAGAGGVSKLIQNGIIKRVSNFKYPYEYINHFNEVINRKTEE